jgi:hypothetical protein
MMGRKALVTSLLLAIVVASFVAILYTSPPSQNRKAIEKTQTTPPVQTITIRGAQTSWVVSRRPTGTPAKKPGEKLGPNLVQNTGFETIVKSDDNFSDVYGNRPFPWGFEILGGNPICISNGSEPHGGRFSIEIIGTSSEDSVLIAIPEYSLKPRISPGRIYRLEAWVKFENLKGPGIRLIQQFFNRTYYWYPEHIVLGPWYSGSSDWIKIALDAKTTDLDNRVGDPLVHFSGEGRLWVDDVSFCEVLEGESDGAANPTGEFGHDRSAPSAPIARSIPQGLEEPLRSPSIPAGALGHLFPLRSKRPQNSLIKRLLAPKDH